MRDILEKLISGEISLEQAEKMIKLFEIEQLNTGIRVDPNREYRTGVPEVIFGEGKNIDDLIRMVDFFLEKKGRCIITRISREKMDQLKERFGDRYVRYSENGRVMVIREKDSDVYPQSGRVAILSGGTSDLGVAEEARMICEELGCETITFYDAGVAGVHRLIPAVKKIIEEDVDAVIVVAGMEGALPSVVAGLVDVPVIGVPVSVGYGAGGGGISALYSILQSCSPGVVAVNIDNGFGAAVAAVKIARRVEKFRKKSNEI